MICAKLLKALVNNQPLEPRHRDHVLIRNWSDFRECFI
ncbi:type II toxin-antitoxin system YafQ family toxin [Bartonella bovis]|nr:type II toxin-antitoxin system YafQ family toxin [Bartonella bovis]